ncbi:MAG: hypothetical protein N3B13_11880, partial [Deltaproteobacteria bacterium]|nr:hypothetical protein [Deltaproteobacteria bacterium]
GFGSFGSYYQSNGIFGELNHRFGKTTGIARYEFSFDEFYDHSRSGFSHRLLLVSSFPVYKKWNFYLGPVLSLDDARLNLYDFFSAGATAGVQVRLSGNSGFVMSGGYEHREYFDNSEERNDNIFIFAARAEYYIFDNVFITTSAVYFSDNSSLKQYTFDRWLLFLGTGLVY